MSFLSLARSEKGITSPKSTHSHQIFVIITKISTEQPIFLTAPLKRTQNTIQAVKTLAAKASAAGQSASKT